MGKKLKEEKGKGFSKEYRCMEEEKLIKEIVNYMEEFDMLRKDEENKSYKIMPITWKIIGHYKQEFLEKE